MDAPGPVPVMGIRASALCRYSESMNDAEAVLAAQELAQRFELIRDLAAHPAINAAVIARQTEEAGKLLSELQVHLLTTVYAL